jgi:UPF0271 protein
MNTRRTIDLNVDLGEGGSQDVALIAQASSANIACGGHAGDESTMRRAIAAAMKAGVAIGAHPGYEDREHFGRVAHDLPLTEVTAAVRRQVEQLAGLVRDAGGALHHVKPHGALYLQANRNTRLAEAVIDAVLPVLPEGLIYAPTGGALAMAAEKAGLRLVAEGFADRRYAETGELLPRSEPGAVIEDLVSAVAQATEIAIRQEVICASGLRIPLRAATLCVHGDGRHAVDTLRAVRKALESAGCAIARPDLAR